MDLLRRILVSIFHHVRGGLGLRSAGKAGPASQWLEITLRPVPFAAGSILSVGTLPRYPCRGGGGRGRSIRRENLESLPVCLEIGGAARGRSDYGPGKGGSVQALPDVGVSGGLPKKTLGPGAKG